MTKKVLFSLLLAAVGTVAAAQGPNPFARPSAQPTAAAPAAGPGTPGVSPEMVPPAVMPGMPGIPAMPGVPGMAGQPGMGPETVEEEVQASRIGKVNGHHIYRGQSTYVFEPTKNRKVVRRISAQALPVVPAVPGSPSANNTSQLPSMVGRPAPRN